MPEPLCLYRGRVEPEWIDEYGHMNMSNYVLACDWGTYAFWEHVNGGLALEERDGAEYAVVETHVNYLGELREGDPFRVETVLLGADAKRFHVFHTLYHDAEGFVAATNEVMALGFDLGTRRLMEFRAPVRERLRAVLAAHAGLPRPANAGRAIAMPAPRSAADE